MTTEVKVSAFSILASLLLATLWGCANQQLDRGVTPADSTAPNVSDSYQNRIEKYSAGDSEYAGFYNNFEYKGTILNTEIRNALLEKQGQYYQWDRAKQATEREKSDREKGAETRVFLTFFTPDRRNDNLSDVRSIWRVYLDVNGQRYAGKVERVRTLLAELQVLYPYHTRWNSPYMVSFPVSTTRIENYPMTFTITGPLGTRAVKFPAL